MHPKLSFLALVLTYAMGASTQILELPIQDRVPKSLMIVESCPDTDYPMVLSSINHPQLWSNQYMVCFRGIPLIFNCSDGLFFNQETLTCDFPYERQLSLISTDPDIPSRPEHPIPINPDMRWRPISTDQDIPNRPEHPISINPDMRWRPISTDQDIAKRPEYPIPINPYVRRIDPSKIPVTRPDPEVVVPLPVLPPMRPMPIPVRPIPYQGNYYYKY